MTADFFPFRIFDLIHRRIAIGSLICEKQDLIKGIHFPIADQLIAFLHARQSFARAKGTHRNLFQIAVAGNRHHDLFIGDHRHFINDDLFDFLFDLRQTRYAELFFYFL